MKKNILLSAFLLLSCVGVNAADWRLVDTQPNNVRLYVDMDSIKLGKTDNEYLYAAKYTAINKPEQLLYLKTDTKTNKLGIIKVEDYSDESYRPVRNLSNPHVYMKDIEEGYFLKPLHDCILAISRNEQLAVGDNGLYVAKNSRINENEQHLAYKTTENPTIVKDEFINYVNTNNAPNNTIRGYLVATCQKIDSNWFPPSTNSQSRVVINASINKKGELDSYDVIESSGDDRIDKSAIKALQDAQPYAKLPANDSTYAMYFKFVFEKGEYGKRVVY